MSLDPEQERIRTELKLSDIDYYYKSGEKNVSTENSFDIVEATVALSVSNGDIALAVQAKREIGKLWDDITKPPYKLMFNGSLTGIRLWNIVRIHRIIEGILNKYQTDDNRIKMYLVHGNRLIAHQTFKRIDISSINDPGCDIDHIIKNIPAIANAVINNLIEAGEEFYPDSYLAHLFKNLSKCRALDDILVKA